MIVSAGRAAGEHSGDAKPPAAIGPAGRVRAAGMYRPAQAWPQRVLVHSRALCKRRTLSQDVVSSWLPNLTGEQAKRQNLFHQTWPAQMQIAPAGEYKCPLRAIQVLGRFPGSRPPSLAHRAGLAGQSGPMIFSIRDSQKTSCFLAPNRCSQKPGEKLATVAARISRAKRGYFTPLRHSRVLRCNN